MNADINIKGLNVVTVYHFFLEEYIRKRQTCTLLRTVDKLFPPRKLGTKAKTVTTTEKTSTITATINAATTTYNATTTTTT